MPAQTGQSKLMQKLGVTGIKAFEDHKNDETDLSSFGALPGGIERGVAQLVECKFGFVQAGKDNAGQPFFYAAGVVKAPSKHEGIPIVGMRTQITEPLYDTPTRGRKTVSDHLGWVLNEMRKLGGDTSNIGPDDLEGMAEALKRAAPHFTFRTWQGKKRKPGEAGYNEQYDGPNSPPPRVNENWSGGCEFNEETVTTITSANGVVDNSAAGRAVAGVGPADTADQFDEPDAVTEEVIEPEGSTTIADADIDALAETADGDGEDSQDAQSFLESKAKELGIPEDDITGAANWTAVVELIKIAQAPEEPTPEPEPPPTPGVLGRVEVQSLVP